MTCWLGFWQPCALRSTPTGRTRLRFQPNPRGKRDVSHIRPSLNAGGSRESLLSFLGLPNTYLVYDLIRLSVRGLERNCTPFQRWPPRHGTLPVSSVCISTGCKAAHRNLGGTICISALSQQPICGRAQSHPGDSIEMTLDRVPGPHSREILCRGRTTSADTSTSAPTLIARARGLIISRHCVYTCVASARAPHHATRSPRTFAPLSSFRHDRPHVGHSGACVQYARIAAIYSKLPRCNRKRFACDTLSLTEAAPSAFQLGRSVGCRHVSTTASRPSTQ